VKWKGRVYRQVIEETEDEPLSLDGLLNESEPELRTTE
jgi:hypothetical protein